MNLYTKIVTSLSDLTDTANILHQEGRSIVWTNGVFDLIHKGHIDYLNKASELGDVLIVGINSDLSVRRLKGEDRPIFDEETRLLKIAAMGFVDLVYLFTDDTPIEPIIAVRPDILVKGGDYLVEEIVGYEEVTSCGGEVITIPFLEGYSSTDYINKIKES